MRFAFRGHGAFAPGSSRLFPLVALLAGCGDDPAFERREPELPLTALAGSHSPLRRGADVLGHCVGRSGTRTALALIDAQQLRVLTSDSPGLEETSFVAAGEVPVFGGVLDCALTATATGFAVASVAIGDEPRALVQRLFEDGSLDGEAVVTGPSVHPGVALASDGDRVYLGRLDAGSDGTEVWVDTIEAGAVTSQRIASCAQPTLPEVAPGKSEVGVFYACAGGEQSEVFGAILRDGQPVTLGAMPASLGQTALAAVSREDSWLVQFIPAGTRATTLPPLLEVDQETFEVTEHPSPTRDRPPSEEVWFVDLVASAEGTFRQLGSCSGVDSEAPGCHIELCALDVARDEESCSSLEHGAPGALLPAGDGATFTYLEQGLDLGGDLYSLLIDGNAAPSRGPSPVLSPGAFTPLSVDCSSSWCTVFGREGQSLLAGADMHRYGFWTTEDAWNADAAVDKAIVLEADGPVVSSAVEPANWSAGLAFHGAAGLQVGAFGAGGPLFTQTLAEPGEPLSLFYEPNDERFRLFELGPDGALASRTVDAASAGPAIAVNAPALQVACGAEGSGYVVLDQETRGSYRLGADGASAAEPLPPVRAGSRELWRCLGASLFGLAYDGTGALLYRGTPSDAGGLRFETWSFGATAGDGALGAGFGAVAGDLWDERVTFFLQRAGGFAEPLVALVVGKQGEPAAYALELPHEAILNAAAAPASGDASVLRLVWSEFGSRTATVSNWALP